MLVVLLNMPFFNLALHRFTMLVYYPFVSISFFDKRTLPREWVSWVIFWRLSRYDEAKIWSGRIFKRGYDLSCDLVFATYMIAWAGGIYFTGMIKSFVYLEHFSPFLNWLHFDDRCCCADKRHSNSLARWPWSIHHVPPSPMPSPSAVRPVSKVKKSENVRQISNWLTQMCVDNFLFLFLSSDPISLLCRRCCYGYRRLRRLETGGRHDFAWRQLCLNRYRRRGRPSDFRQFEEIHRLYFDVQHSWNLSLLDVYSSWHPSAFGHLSPSCVSIWVPTW